MKSNLTIIKVGGKIVENPILLKKLLEDFTKISGYKMLVHGGGRLATKLAEQLGIESNIVDGRRITNKDMLQIVTMVYGGLVNKNIVAKLQAINTNALGLTGADINCMLSNKRPVKNIDYGYVGDVKKVDGKILSELIKKNIVPVVAPITHDKKGNLLNTNADTIASEVAKALATYFEVKLIFCFEKRGVLYDNNDDESIIKSINRDEYKQLINSDTIKDGMIPKIDNAFNALDNGVKSVVITSATHFLDKNDGTKIVLQ